MQMPKLIPKNFYILLSMSHIIIMSYIQSYFIKIIIVLKNYQLILVKLILVIAPTKY